MPTFPNFRPDIFWKTQRDLTYVDINFKTEGSKEFNFWKDFYFALSANYLLQRHTTDVCSIYKYRSSYIIKHWPTGNFTMENESIRVFRSFYPERIIDKKDYTNCFPKPLNSWLPCQVQARRRCRRLSCG